MMRFALSCAASEGVRCPEPEATPLLQDVCLRGALCECGSPPATERQAPLPRKPRVDQSVLYGEHTVMSAVTGNHFATLVALIQGHFAANLLGPPGGCFCPCPTPGFSRRPSSHRTGLWLWDAVSQ